MKLVHNLLMFLIIAAKVRFGLNESVTFVASCSKLYFNYPEVSDGLYGMASGITHNFVNPTKRQ